jgi:hypothetical protein
VCATPSVDLSGDLRILDREIGDHLAGSPGERLVDADFGPGEEVAQLQPHGSLLLSPGMSTRTYGRQAAPIASLR